MTNPTSNILFETIEPGIGMLWLNRAEKRNALSTGLLRDMTDRLAMLEEDSRQRVVILRGKGPVFCGGLDLHEASEEGDPREMASLVAGLIVRLFTSRIVYVAAAHGAACAGGAALAVSCDQVIAARGFKIGFPEVRRGLAPALLLPVLRRKVRDAHLRELLLTGLPISAERAKEIGLLHQVVEEDALTATAIDYARSIREAAPSVVVAAKAMIAALHQPPLATEMDAALEEHLRVWHSATGHEGITAFREKRTPRWLEI